MLIRRGFEFWPSAFPRCGGLSQSPINIDRWLFTLILWTKLIRIKDICKQDQDLKKPHQQEISCAQKPAKIAFSRVQ